MIGGKDGGDPGGKRSCQRAAIAPVFGIAPGDNLAVVLECRESAPSGEDPGDATGKMLGNTAAVAAQFPNP